MINVYTAHACVRASDTKTVTSSAAPAAAPYARQTDHRTWPTSRSSAGTASAAPTYKYGIRKDSIRFAVSDTASDSQTYILATLDALIRCGLYAVS